VEGYAAKPYDWIYVLEILDRRFAVDTRQGVRIPVSAAAWSFLASSIFRSGDAANGDGRDHERQAPAPPLEISAELDALTRGEKPVTPASEDPAPRLQTLTLNVAHACNLKCDYCFEDWPSLMEGFNRNGTGRMTPETAEKAIDLLIRESGKIEDLVISFFGGEPLLNWPVVKSTVEYCEKVAPRHGKRFKFTITTNATRLTAEIEDFLLEKGFEIIISVDGAPQVNDKHRVFHSGRGSGELVLEKAKRFQKRVTDEGKSTSLTVRGTYFRNTMDFESSTFYLAEEGFDRISMENGVLRETHPSALRQEDLPVLRKQYDRFVKRLADELIEGKSRFRHFHMTRVLETVGLRKPLKRECGAGTGYLAVSASGNLYPCHKFVGAEDVKMGSVDEGVTRREVGLQLWNTNVETKEECRQCWARYLCGGGCHADAHLVHGRFNRPDPVSCELLRHRVRLGFYLMSRLEEEAPELLREIVPEAVTAISQPRRSPAVRSTPKGDGLLLFHARTRKVHELNRVSAEIWSLCDGDHDVGRIGEAVSARFNVTQGQTQGDVLQTIQEFQRMELVS
jgi:uncharacterized protein